MPERNDDLIDDLLDDAEMDVQEAEPVIGIDPALPGEDETVEYKVPTISYSTQEVWFAKTSRTNLDKIYLQGQDHVKNPVCTEFAKRLDEGWRLHTMHLAANDMDVFIVLTRG